MSRQIQIRRGTTAEHENFTGAIGELTMDTDKKTLRIHDGETPGGLEISGGGGNVNFELIESYQNDNNWYKIFRETDTQTGEIKYWCEQGGYVLSGVPSGTTVNLMVKKTSGLEFYVGSCASSTLHRCSFGNFTETSFKIYKEAGVYWRTESYCEYTGE